MTVSSSSSQVPVSSSHIDANGNVVMIDVSQKAPSARAATAKGFIAVSSHVVAAVRNQQMKKGDVLTVAQLAGIMGAKKTAELIPLCHPLPLTNCLVTLEVTDCGIWATCTAKTQGPTGVEMEALTGASVALLTIYDMCKSMDKAMEIGQIHIVHKAGGKSREYRRP